MDALFIKKITLSAVISIFVCIIIFSTTVSAENTKSGLWGRVTDKQTGAPLPARIVVENGRNGIINSYYKALPGFFTGEDGRFKVNLQPGRYTVTAFHGIDYLSEEKHIHIPPDSVAGLTFRLDRWVPLRQLGWVNGDGHAHLYTDIEKNDKMLAEVRRICRAQGVDFISTNQGWAGYDENNWREGYGRFSDDAFLLHYGAEMPKYRTGHTWWLNLASCHGLYDAAMDTMYETMYYQREAIPRWTFKECPFVNIPGVELVQRLQKIENAVALVPHPTSWWWQQRGDVKKYTTNVCEYLSFSLLAGGIWDGLVVMGYDRDHYFYQNLWFNVLNLGYRMTPVAELDGGYGRNNKFPYGSMRCYYWVGEDMRMENIARAVRTGRTFVTSGPIVFTDIDGSFDTGDTVPADGTQRRLNIKAFASGDRQDFLSYVLVFRNGKIFKLWDLRNVKPRRWAHFITLKEQENAWYAVKVYGKIAPGLADHLDVMHVCERIQNGVFEGAVKKENSMAFTAPIYFRKTGYSGQEVLNAKVRLELLHPHTNRPVKNAAVDIFKNGDKIKTRMVKNGSVEFSMPVHAVLRISAANNPVIYRSLYLDYPPHRRLIERFANGDWLAENNWNNILQPGQVPWPAFQYAETKAVLDEVDWKVMLRPNVRDRVWEKFMQDIKTAGID